MKKIAFLAPVVLLLGCATSEVTYLPDGGEGHSIQCGNQPALCDQKAGELCGAMGYTVVSKSDTKQADLSSNQYGTYASANTQHSMLIKCGKESQLD